MLRAAIKNLLGHKLRMFLTAFSIILGVSFVSGTYIFTDSIGRTFDNLFSEVFSGVDVTVRPQTADFGESAESFSTDILETIRQVDGVSVAEPGANGFAQLLDKQGEPVGGQGPPTLGFSWGVEPGLNPLQIGEGDGRAPEQPGEVVIDKATADLNDFAVGDTLQILLGGPAEEFKLVGIATFGSSDGLAGATLAAFELSEAQRVFGLEDSFSEINIKATTDVTPDELKSRIDQVLPDTVESITGAQQSNEQLDEINEGLGFINTAMLVFAGVSILVGVFVIYNTFQIIVAQRSKELALLRAIGATKLQVIRLVIYEATIVAVISSAIGILAGALIAQGVRGLMNAIGFGLPGGPITIEPRTVVIALAVGLGSTLVSALFPAIRASRVSPVEAMRDNEASSTNRRSLFTRGIIGLVLTAVGALAIFYGLNGNDVNQPLYFVGGGALGMFLGVAVFAPLLSRPLAQVIGWPWVKTRGVPARLARDNAKRTPRRTASSAAALMIGVSIVTMFTVLAATFKSNITSILDDSFPADLTVLSTNIGDAGPGSAGFPVSVQETVNGLPDVEDATAFRYQLEGARLGDDILFIAGIDAGSASQVIRLGETAGAYKALGDNGILIAQETLDDRGWTIGQTIDLEFAQTGTQSLEIVGAFTEPFDTDYIISTETYLANFDSDVITLLAMNLREGVDPEQGKQDVKDALSGFAQLNVQDKGDLFETIETQLDQLLASIWGLVGLAIVIAVLGITNTLLLSISERTREIGMLRAIGMTRRQTRRMVRYESIIIALFGAILGVAMGAFFAWAVIQALESEGISGYTFSFGTVITYFVLAIVAGVMAAALPARKAARMDILKAIYHD